VAGIFGSPAKENAARHFCTRLNTPALEVHSVGRQHCFREGLGTDAGARVADNISDQKPWYPIGAKMQEIAIRDLLKRKGRWIIKADRMVLMYTETPTRKFPSQMKILGVLPCCLIATTGTCIYAQDLPPRIEVGLHLAALDETGLGEKPLGGGGGISYRLSPYVAVDSEVNRYPIGGAAANFPVTQVLFGARAGIRFGKMGFFGKIRPGFGIYDNTLYQPSIGTKANLDAGVVLEFYSARHVGARIDFGDTIIFFGSNQIGSPVGPKTLGTRNHFQGSFGVFIHF
jgi:hypothetical protein